MNFETFDGTPEALVTYLGTLAATTIHQLVLSHIKGKYIIVWS